METKQAKADPAEDLAIRFLLAEDLIKHDGKTTEVRPVFKIGKTAKSNAKVVEVPNTFHAVKVEPPKKVRKEYPFQGYLDFQGIKIDVENVKGSTRSGTGSEGDWSTQMFAHYGEIRGTKGTDGDMLDVYVGDNHDSSLVVVVHQYNPWDGKYDEDKVIIGYESVEEAIGLYKKQYDRPGFYREGEYTAMPIGAFWRWVKDTRNKGKRVKVTALNQNPYVYDNFGSDFYVQFDVQRRRGKLTLSWTGSGFKDTNVVRSEPEPFPTRAAAERAIRTKLISFIKKWRANDIDQVFGWGKVAMSQRLPTPRGICNNDARDRTFTVLALLRALAWSHQASHWQISGDSSYGDHQLFDRIYGPILGEIDTLAEKLIGTFGPSVVDPTDQAQMMAHFVSSIVTIKDPFERGLHGERVLQVILKDSVHYLEDVGQLSLGLDDFLRTLADNHETNIYLLQQRLGALRVASVTANPKQASRRRRRAFSARCMLQAILREPLRFL